MRPSLLLKLHSKFKHNLRKHRVVIVRHCIAGKKCMNSKFPGAFTLQDAECIKNLFRSHAIFGIPRIIHNIIADLEHSTWIVTAADDLRNLSNSFLYTLNMSDVIKIDNSTDLICIFKLFIRSVIRGKHNVSLLASDSFGKHQFCHG